jgi:4-amino-4-deoxy-L-arabinose transferase-like glycosyltransferase
MMKRISSEVIGYAKWGAREWLLLALLVAGAGALRLLLFNGFFGSDDLSYVLRSVQIANGDWSSSDYIGSLRYGYNIPAALPIRVFGANALSATAWALICSLAEVAAVYLFASAFIGRRAGVYAAILLATAPLHIAVATRIHPDPVLACFLTLSFMLFYVAERGGRPLLYFFAGLAMGMVFWVKELALLALLTFLTYPLAARRYDRKWLWTVAGGAVMLAAHLALMQVIAGNPLHALNAAAAGVGQITQTAAFEDSPGFYFRYLLVDIKHSFLLAYFAIAALISFLLGRLPSGAPGAPGDRGMSCSGYVAWWLLALLVFLTFFPVSFEPLRLAMKQANYLNMLFAPMAILGGAWLAQRSSRRLRAVLLGVAALGGIGLGALEQADYQVFTANSKAAVELAARHPSAELLGSTNNADMAYIRSILDNDPTLRLRFGELGERSAEAAKDGPGAPASSNVLVIVDRENQHWSNPALVVDTIPKCWTKVEDLRPLGIGLGANLAQGARVLARMLPERLAGSVDARLRQLAEPALATVYRVNGGLLWCGGAAPGGPPPSATALQTTR